jgi:apolipoprotein N-acyltransferase
MSRKRILLYAILSGFILCIPWYRGFSGIILWIAFIPLLLIEDSYFVTCNKPKKEVFLYASLTFFLWNTLTTWWIVNATIIGACTAVFLNTFLFSLVFWFYHITRKISGNVIGCISFVAYWTAFEYLYLNAEISWPWLNLGNGFANNIRVIQWYEYTGVLGGTIWILLINIILFHLLKKFEGGTKRQFLIACIFCLSMLIFCPLIWSIVRYNNYKEKENPYRITIIQPNIDPFSEKFSGMSPDQQLDILLQQSSIAGNDSTDYFVGPETAIQGKNNESAINNNHAVNKIRTFLVKYPKAKFVLGAETFKEYMLGEKRSVTAHKTNDTGKWIDYFNAALQIDTSSSVQIYHKSKLVSGVEKMPFAKYFHFLEKYTLVSGGATGSRGVQSNRGTFYSPVNKTRIAPVICYESVFGEYVTGYIKNNAGLLFILTNDGWFGNTPGHLQHLSYARLRAIESRRSIARSANTGQSAFINQRGEIISSMGWGQRGNITASINANEVQTFYVRHGDYLGKFACIISVVIMLIVLINYLKHSRTHSSPTHFS